jgi:hypothetical protein
VCNEECLKMVERKIEDATFRCKEGGVCLTAFG